MSVIDAVSFLLVLLGALFFLAGTAGLVRFPDVFSRLHALTKADNLGLGFIVLGLALQAGSGLVLLKLVLIWMLALLASAVTCHLIARHALQGGVGNFSPDGEGRTPRHQPRGRTPSLPLGTPIGKATAPRGGELTSKVLVTSPELRPKP